MTTLKNRHKIIYDPGTGAVTITGTLSMGAWKPSTMAADGGSDESAAGVGETFVVRWLEAAELLIHFTEAEYAAIRTWWKWAATTLDQFTFYFDADLGTNFTVKLVSPTIKEGFAPERMDGFPWNWQLRVKIRTADNATPLISALP